MTKYSKREIYFKGLDIVRSCKTPAQIAVALKWLRLTKRHLSISQRADLLREALAHSLRTF
jgi:hypothetical protein